jgi:hypothetical protein
MSKQHSLVNTKSFTILSIAFISFFTPFVTVFLHGLQGFIPLFSIGIIIMLYSNSYKWVFGNIKATISHNRWFYYLMLSYIISSVLRQSYGSSISSNILLVLNITVPFLGLLFAFGYANEFNCQRKFIIILIFFLGIQSILSLPVLFNSPGIARFYFETNEGDWSFGNPSYFALTIVFIPALIWWSLRESKILRFILISFLGLTTLTAFISSFSTPLGLGIAGVLIISILSLFLKNAFRFNLKGIILGLSILLISYYTYSNIKQNSLLIGSSEKIENAFRDPTSGGLNNTQSKSNSRWIISKKSFNTFLMNPIFGVGNGTRLNKYLGGHSSLFDLLGAFGILGGGLAYIVFVLLMIKLSWKLFLKYRSWSSVLFLTTVILYLISGVVNPYWEGISSAFILILTRPYYVSKQKERYNSIEKN